MIINMRHSIFGAGVIVTLLGLASCQNLDLNPLSQGSSETWNSNEDEIVMSLRDLYRDRFWPTDQESWTDDYTNRDVTSTIINGTLSGQTYEVTDLWDAQYKMVGRANTVILNAYKAKANGLSDATVARYVAEARFLRATAYCRLTEKFGDVPYVDSLLSIDRAFAYGRTPVSEVNRHIYDDFEAAASLLPSTCSDERRATKWAALGFEARHALYMGDYARAAAAGKKVIDESPYKLHDDYADLFLPNPAKSNTDEVIFALPRSEELYDKSSATEPYVIHTQPYLPRMHGGYAQYCPSWDLLASYLCTDGLPIDQSPLFNPKKPFDNRDPRLAATIVPFGSSFLGIEYDPSPLKTKVMNYSTGREVANQDTRYNMQYASYNGLALKKGVDETWADAGFLASNDKILLRLAEIYLDYAEAKIELGETDQSVLDAINTVRARAYHCTKDQVTRYPAVTTNNQTELRRIVRMERRMELAWEGLRYMDLVRWHLAEKALTRKNYGMRYPMDTSDFYMQNWFWAAAPAIDEDGLPDFSVLESQQKIQALSQRSWTNRQYLWPIPTTDLEINPNMLPNNPGY